MNKNIIYKSKNIEEFYGAHRTKWDEFYESERKVISKLGLHAGSAVLDIGCGCAGLGLALNERFGVTKYTGVEINDRAARTAKRLYPQAQIINSDILSLSVDEFPINRKFDVVFSLSCIDWNTQFSEMLESGYSFVKTGGYFVSSFRLTEKESTNDLSKSFQYINFDGRKEGEIAPYVVMNIKELVELLSELHSQEISGYGYWGAPSESAVTPFTRICFAVIAVKKSSSKTSQPILHLDLPKDLWGLDQ